MDRPVEDRCRDRDKDKAIARKAWFADSQYSSAPGLLVRAGPQDRVRLTVVGGRVNSVAARIPPALRVQAFRHAREWA
jgi:hypothetical protein